MNSKPPNQLSASQRQLLAAIGIPLWHQRTAEPAVADQNLSYCRIGQWLLVAPEFPIPNPPWFVDLCQALAFAQPNEVSSVPVEVSASIASTWTKGLIIEFNEPLPDTPAHDVKRAWWKQLCQSH